VVDAVAGAEEHRQFDVDESDGRQFSKEPRPRVLQPAHERCPSPALQRRPQIFDAVPGSQQTEDAGNARGWHDHWQVNHHRPARLENAGDLREVRVRQCHGVEVLEDMCGKRGISRGGRHWQCHAVTQPEIDV
jgi:hypothetical protein